MGVPRASEALAMPSITCENCHMTSGFSGLPKLRQFVAARGRAPLAATLRAASATACIAPRCGLSWHQRPLPSVESARSEEHTSELQSRFDLVCRLLLEKKKKKKLNKV